MILRDRHTLKTRTHHTHQQNTLLLYIVEHVDHTAFWRWLVPAKAKVLKTNPTKTTIPGNYYSTPLIATYTCKLFTGYGKVLYSFCCTVEINIQLGTKIWEMKLIFQEKKTLFSYCKYWKCDHWLLYPRYICFCRKNNQGWCRFIILTRAWFSCDEHVYCWKSKKVCIWNIMAQLQLGDFMSNKVDY